MNDASDSDIEVGGLEPMGREKSSNPSKRRSPACTELLKRMNSGTDFFTVRNDINKASREGQLRQGELPLLTARLDRLIARRVREEAPPRPHQQDEVFVEGPAGSKGAPKPQLFRKPAVPERKSLPPEPVRMESQAPPRRTVQQDMVILNSRGSIGIFTRRR